MSVFLERNFSLALGAWAVLFTRAARAWKAAGAAW